MKNVIKTFSKIKFVILIFYIKNIVFKLIYFTVLINPPQKIYWFTFYKRRHLSMFLIKNICKILTLMYFENLELLFKKLKWVLSKREVKSKNEEYKKCFFTRTNYIL